MLVPENLTIQPVFGMVMHAFHGLNAATLHSAADLLISDERFISILSQEWQNMLATIIQRGF